MTQGTMAACNQAAQNNASTPRARARCRRRTQWRPKFTPDTFSARVEPYPLVTARRKQQCRRPIQIAEIARRAGTLLR